MAATRFLFFFIRVLFNYSGLTVFIPSKMMIFAAFRWNQFSTHSVSTEYRILQPFNIDDLKVIGS